MPLMLLTKYEAWCLKCSKYNGSLSYDEWVKQGRRCTFCNSTKVELLEWEDSDASNVEVG